MENTTNYEALGFLICFIILFFAWLIHLDGKQRKYEIKYLRGWFIVRDVKTEKPVSPKFATKEQAEIWFNENCKDV